VKARVFQRFVCVAALATWTTNAPNAYAAPDAMSVGKSVPAATKQLWTAGWDNFDEPLNYASSNITWQASSGKLSMTFVLNSATPSKLYQMHVNFFCTQGDVPKKTFGRFPIDAPCADLTRQGVTAEILAVELGTVLTDAKGTGSFQVVVDHVKSGTYAVEFGARDGAGCYVLGGAGNGNNCLLDFQSPGPFGTTTTIVVP
jgi:hypothetical protein